MHVQEGKNVSYSRSIEEAKAAIKSIEPNNEANAKGSPILNGQESGGPAGPGEIVPKRYTLGKHTTESKRTA
jgi:hypothetical protein